MQNNPDQNLWIVAVIVVLFLALRMRKKFRPNLTAFGKAIWASDRALALAGFFGRKGFILGRTLSGRLLRVPRITHVLIVGGSGSGKSLIITSNILKNCDSSLIVFDVFGDLRTSAACNRKQRRGRFVWFAPYAGGSDCINIFDTIKPDSLLVDKARSIAVSLVTVTETEDPHWNARATDFLTACIVLVLLRFEGEERSLNSVADIASDPKLVRAAGIKLQEMGAIPGRLGNQVLSLFEDGGELTKEGSGVLATVSRHLSFLNSDPVRKAVAKSTFRIDKLTPRTPLFIEIGPNHLESAKGLIRCIFSTIVREIGEKGSEKNEVLCLWDEASVLSGLPALEEALVRGRHGGLRLAVAFQSDSTVQAAFKDKRTLLYDNCSTQIYVGQASSYETAERIVKNLGSCTQVLEGFDENTGRSWQQGGSQEQAHGVNFSRGSSFSYSVAEKPLMRPEEIMTLDPGLLICFTKLAPPILARRILWYKERFFCGGNRSLRFSPWWAAVAAVTGFFVWLLTK